jgi:hypothetical protein
MTPTSQPLTVSAQTSVSIIEANQETNINEKSKERTDAADVRDGHSEFGLELALEIENRTGVHGDVAIVRSAKISRITCQSSAIVVREDHLSRIAR